VDEHTRSVVGRWPHSFMSENCARLTTRGQRGGGRTLWGAFPGVKAGPWHKCEDKVPRAPRCANGGSLGLSSRQPEDLGPRTADALGKGAPLTRTTIIDYLIFSLTDLRSIGTTWVLTTA
jgi:hypothetical protein